METSKEKDKWRDFFGEPYIPIDDPMESNVYHCDNAEWKRVESIADDPELPFDEREGWQRLKLWEIGQCLSSGGKLSSDPARWIGRVLQNIARGEDAKREMGLQRGRGPYTKVIRERAWAAEMTWLTHNGMTQEAAAEKIADQEGLAEVRMVKEAHNNLKARKGIFKRIQEVVVRSGVVPQVILRSDYEEFIWGEAE